LAFGILAATQSASAQGGLPMQDSYGGGLYGLSPRNDRGTSRTTLSPRSQHRQPVRVHLTRPGYQVKPRVTHNSRPNNYNTNRSVFRNPGYQVQVRQPQKSWKMVWSTTAYRDQAWSTIQRLKNQGYHVTHRERTIPYQGYRTVQVVDIYCYLWQ
jgi:hypothetical protein